MLLPKTTFWFFAVLETGGTTTRKGDYAACLPGGWGCPDERAGRERTVPFEDGRPRRGACGAVSGSGGTRYPNTAPTVHTRSVTPAAIADVRSRHVRVQPPCRRRSAAGAAHPLSAQPTSHSPASTVARQRAGARARPLPRRQALPGRRVEPLAIGCVQGRSAVRRRPPRGAGHGLLGPDHRPAHDPLAPVEGRLDNLPPQEAQRPAQRRPAHPSPAPRDAEERAGGAARRSPRPRTRPPAAGTRARRPRP